MPKIYLKKIASIFVPGGEIRLEEQLLEDVRVFQTYWVGKSLSGLFSTALFVFMALAGGLCLPAIANSDPINISNLTSLTNEVDDIPEEVLRTEIYAEGRSPVDGKLLSASEYIELNEQLRETIENIPPKFLVSERLQRLIDLLRLRRLIRQVIPFF